MGKLLKKGIAHMLSVLIILSALGACITAFGVATLEVYAEDGAAKIGTTEYDTLQGAMDAAVDDDTITLLRDVTEAVTFNKDASVTLDLNDKILTAEPDKVILTISNGTLTLVDNAQSKTTRNYKLNSDGVADLADDGDKSFSGGCVYGARDTESPGVAHGVLIEKGALIMESGTIIGNASNSDGGGIRLGSGTDYTDTSFTMNGGSILGNRSEFGGAISCAGTEDRCIATINGGVISYNLGEQHSGAIYAGRKVVINGGVITYNHTEGYSDSVGGAIDFSYNAPSSGLVISGNPIIQNNTRTPAGGSKEISNIVVSGYTGYSQSRFTLGNLSDDAKIGVSLFIDGNKSQGVFTVGSTPENSANAFSKGLFTSDHGFYVKVHESSDNLNDQMELADPGFTVTGPEDLRLDAGETGKLSVTATPKEGSVGTMAYQWYKVTDTGNELIEGATSEDLTVGDGLDAGTYKYVCKVTFTPTGGSAISLDSRIATVTVNPGPDEYNITVEPVTGGTAAVKDPSGKTVEKAVPGTEITVTATPENGYVLDKIIIEYDGADSPKDITDAGKFSMPASAVNVKVTFKKQDTHVVTRYTITYDLNGGTLDGKTGTVTEKFDAGTIITLPESTKDGYTFDYWEGSKYNAGDEYTVNEDHTFTAVWKAAEPAKPDNVPNTGDNGNTGLWTVLFGGSLLAAIMLIIAGRKYLKNKR